MDQASGQGSLESEAGCIFKAFEVAILVASLESRAGLPVVSIVRVWDVVTRAERGLKRGDIGVLALKANKVNEDGSDGARLLWCTQVGDEI